jgi:ATP-dependent helicase/nuclease subunit B
MERLADGVAVEVLIHAPLELSAGFDAWGQPISAYWRNQVIDFVSEERILLRGDGDAQAAEVIALVARSGRAQNSRDFAVGIPAQSLLPAVSRAFGERGVQTFDPAGVPLAACGMFRLLDTTAHLIFERSWECFAALVRHADFLRYLTTALPDLDCRALLCQVDDFQNQHLPRTLEEIGRFLHSGHQNDYAMLRKVFAVVAALIAEPSTRRPAAFVREFLAAVYGQVEIDSSIEQQSGRREIVEAVVAALEESEGTVMERLGLSWEAGLQVMLAILRKKSVFPPHPLQAVALLGWLELHWESAALLVIAGMNEGVVPEAVGGDVFLPDAPRQRLGLKDNDTRLGRDIYLLSAMIRSRPVGSVYCIAGKTAADGEPLKPSRLLLRCPDGILPQRARRLFGPIGPPASAAAAAGHQWLLRPRIAPPPPSLPVTGFRDYLRCPFRFYLGHVLAMQAMDDRKAEADSRDFGRACHQAFEALAAEDSLAQCDDPAIIAAFLQAAASRWFGHRFGPELSVVLMVQLESLRERLAMAARIEAARRREGWRTLRAEYRLGGGAGVPFHGTTIRGTIDRIDERDGELCIIDYKTADHAKEPGAGHLGSVTAQTPSWACVELDGGQKAWTDLQLPLYRLLLRADRLFSGYRRIGCGYFNLPKDIAATGLLLWDELDERLIASAAECGRRIVANIRERVFWPPAQGVHYDEYESLYVDSLGDAINEEWFRTAVAHA